jgi:hypothetical protein
MSSWERWLVRHSFILSAVRNRGSQLPSNSSFLEEAREMAKIPSREGHLHFS